MTDLNGIVLAGGRSIRMKTDKAFLMYHGLEQYQYLVNLLDNFCNDIYVSCRTEQQFSCKCICDLAEYAGIGPAAAWFSVFNTSLKAFVILGIDYPYFNLEELRNLILNRDKKAVASVLYNQETGFYEPMLGIYEASFYNILISQADTTGISIQSILRKSNVKKVLPLNNNAIRSIDNPDDYQATLFSLNGK